jgi:hypothetical protein
MNPARIEAVLGYALAVAAQADHPRDRELGPIHLLKYLYLADLAHAETHGGESYSGVDWRFHKFGPWAVEAFQQTRPAMSHLHAECRDFTSRYREDNFRWRVPDDRLDLGKVGLPLDVARALADAVRVFGSDTSALLHHVYRTPPMLRARPGDCLDLRPELEPVEAEEATPVEPLPEIKLSKTRLKKMREEVQRRLAKKREARRTVVPQPPPRYDEVFAEGVAWLDGPEPEPRRGKLSFSDDVWTSRARGDTELQLR